MTWMVNVFFSKFTSSTMPDRWSHSPLTTWTVSPATTSYLCSLVYWRAVGLGLNAVSLISVETQFSTGWYWPILRLMTTGLHNATSPSCTQDTFPHSCDAFPHSRLVHIVAHLRIPMHLRIPLRIFAFHCASSCFTVHLRVSPRIFVFHHTSSCSIAIQCASSQEHPSIVQPVPWCVAFHLLLYLTMFGIVRLLFRYGPLLYLLRVLPIHFRALGRRLCAT